MIRHLATAVLLTMIFFMATVVCAGAFVVLGDIVISAGGIDFFPAWMLVGVAALAATLLFIAGSIPVSIRLLQRIG